MKVLLRADVDGVGHKGDVLDVADGFARNYLVPNGLAIRATAGAEAQAASMRRARELKDARERGEAEEMASRLVAMTITIAARAGAEGKLYGSVTTADIVRAVEEQGNVVLDRRILRTEPIKELGVHTVFAKPHTDVEFPITVEVISD